MTAEEAIKVLTTIKKHGYWTMTPINSDAITRALEALEREKALGIGE